MDLYSSCCNIVKDFISKNDSLFEYSEFENIAFEVNYKANMYLPATLPKYKILSLSSYYPNGIGDVAFFEVYSNGSFGIKNQNFISNIDELKTSLKLLKKLALKNIKTYKEYLKNKMISNIENI